MAIFNGTPGNDFFVGTSSADTLTGFGGNDTLNGAGGNDRILGNQGVDRLLGGSGSDNVFGGQNADRIFGGMGNDVLRGDNGSDFLSRDGGIDTLFGGSGPDAFFNSLGDSTPDFNPAEGDIKIGPMSRFSVGNSIDFETSFSDIAEESPSIAELKREGYDLVITISGEEDYFARYRGAGEEINDPYLFLNSIKFIDSDQYSSLLNIGDSVDSDISSEFEDEPVLDSSESTPPLDLLSGLTADEAFLTQYIEELEASGADEEVIEDVKDSLLNVQGDIEDELIRQQEPADILLLPEQVFLIEEGTTIPTEFQDKVMGSEVLALPEGFFEEFFTPIDIESLFPGLL
jgi:hypothetical protein